MPSLDTGIANAGLSILADAFNASFQEVQWVVLAYLLSVTTLIVSAGRLGDAFGRKRLLLAGIVVFTVSSLACGLAPTLGVLLTARLAQGLGAALMASLAVALVGDAVPKAKTGSVLGLLGTMSAVGTALGPSLGGLLMTGFGWSAIFLVNVPVGILALALAHRHLPADRPGMPLKETHFDLTGTGLLALTLAAYALSLTPERGHFGPVNAALLLGAMGGMALFVLVESRAASPLVRATALRDPVLLPGLIMSFLVSTVMMTTLVVGPFYLLRSLELAPALAGPLLSLGPLVAALTGLPAGRVVDHFGAERITRAGLAGIAAGATAVSLLPTHLGVLGYLGPIVVMTASYALFQTANNTAIMSAAPPDQRGASAGMLGLSRNLGLITGAALMGAVFVFSSASPDITTAPPQAIARAMQSTFAFAALLIILAFAVAARRRPARNPRKPGDLSG